MSRFFSLWYLCLYLGVEFAQASQTDSTKLDAPANKTFDNISSNVFYAELGGNAGFFSFDYERAVQRDIWIRAGYGWMIQETPVTLQDNRNHFVYPKVGLFMLEYSHLVNRNNDEVWRWEVGVGIFSHLSSPYYETPGEGLSSSTLGAGNLSIRVQYPDGGFWMRFGVVTWTDIRLWNWSGGIAIGYGF